MINATSYTTAVSAEPVTLEQARAHLRVDATGSPPTHPDDALITAQITAAREWAEQHINKAIATQTITAKFDRFGELYLPLGNALTITSITYLDADGVSQTVPSGDYLLSADSIYTKAGKTWPETADQRDAVTVVYTAGVATKSAERGILILVGDMYEHRESTIVGTITSTVETVRLLLWPLRRVGL